MKLVFMGTPDFARCCLQRLYDDGADIAAVFTQPDKPKNRGMKLMQSPVKELALAHDTPVFQPPTLKDGQAARLLRQICPDLIVAVAYGKLLPEDILSIPAMGCLNIHGSLLPRFRGSAPIQWTVLSGDEIAGVTAMYMGTGMDTGDMLGSLSTPVGEKETSGELFDRLAVLGAQLLSTTIRDIEHGTAHPVPQDEKLATYAPPLKKEQSPIDWFQNGRMIIKQICGLNPWPVATAQVGETILKVFDADFVPCSQPNTPGTVLSGGKSGIEIACPDGSVFLKEVQAPGKKRMAAADYLRGHPICV